MADRMDNLIAETLLALARDAEAHYVPDVEFEESETASTEGRSERSDSLSDEDGMMAALSAGSSRYN